MSSPQGGAVEYSGDPLQDFTLIRFLDRFVFRNPKQLKGKRKKHNITERKWIRILTGSLDLASK